MMTIFSSPKSLTRLALGICSTALSLASGCSGSVHSNSDGGSGPPPNQCATRDDALSKPQCQLTLGQSVNDYIRRLDDQVWYSFHMPPTTNAKSLVHVTAGYGAPSTPVNLSVNLLSASNGSSLGSAVDNHGQGSPKLVDILIRFADPNDQIVVLLNDGGGATGRPNFDARNPFTVKAEVVDDPNPNPPNDVVPTPIVLADQSGILTGTTYGYLVVPDDLHKFKITAPPFSGRKILYIHVTAPRVIPPQPYRLSYTLLDPNGTPISVDHSDNEFIAVDLATARLARPGDYTLIIQPYHPPDDPTPIQGDLRVRWTILAMLMSDLDLNEPNDTLETATKIPIPSVGSKVTAIGRIAEVPDPDWFEFDLPATADPTLFHYKLTPLSNGGRFPPIPGPIDREVVVLTQVGAGCATDPVVCPKGYGNNPLLQSLVQGYCTGYTPPRCLQSQRDESFVFPNLRNFEGMLTVPPQGGIKYFVLVQDQGNNWADDKDYQLDVELLADPDEATFYSGGVKAAKLINPLAQDPSASTLNGTLSYGKGNLISNDPNQGQGVWAPTDYDSTQSDTDSYELHFPGGQGFPLDRSWKLQWSVDGGGTPGPYDLFFSLQFCDGFALDGGSLPDGGTCTIVDRTDQGHPLTLSYTAASLTSWHHLGPLQPIYDRASDGTTTVRPYGCFCFEPRFVSGGKFFLNISAVDRNNYVRAPYSIVTSFSGYPQSYPLPDGGNQSCPPPDAGVDGGPIAGCQFTRE